MDWISGQNLGQNLEGSQTALWKTKSESSYNKQSE